MTKELDFDRAIENAKVSVRASDGEVIYYGPASKMPDDDDGVKAALARGENVAIHFDVLAKDTIAPEDEGDD